MLKIPFKKPESVSFTKPLEDAIRNVFQEDPQQYSDDFEQLAQLRLSIQDPQDHESSIETHLIYYCQLHFLESKFQFDEDHVNLFFSWSNAFGVQDSVSSHNIGFEKASVLFNLGAIYNHLGISAGSSSDDSCKISANYFQKAAGVYQTISDKLSNWNILGNANTQLLALSNLNLALAQEVFLSKAMNQKMKDGTLAKLAMQVSQFYAVTYDIASNTEIFNKAWLSQMQSKQFQFAGLAQYYKSLECETAGKYGEQVGWLAAGVTSLKSALDKNLVKHIPNDAYIEELKTLQSKIDIQYQKANKDNDKIYMECVPKELPTLPPARMVNPTMVGEVNELSSLVSRPFFRHLVPYKIHQAVSKYSYKKDQLVKSLIAKLTEANSIAYTSLTSQRLPGSIEALEQPIGLPSIVLERSREIREIGGVGSLEASWDTLTSFSNKDSLLLNQIVGVLLKEAEEDAELRRIHGHKWTRALSEQLTQKLHEKIKEYRNKMDSANKSNQIVKQKLDQSMHLIQALEMNQKELEASIPSSTQTSTLALKDPNLKELKQMLEILNGNMKKKKMLVEEIKKAGEIDDIASRMTLVSLNDAKFDETLFIEEQLKQYDAQSKLIDQLVLEQEKLLDAIHLKNKEFINSSKTNTMIREREQALTNLEIGYKYFKDISGNLDEGVKFFSEMEMVLQKFLTQVTEFVKSRDVEKEQMLNQIKSTSAYPLPPVSSYGNPPVPGVWNPQTQPQFNYQSSQSFQPSQPVYQPQPSQPVYQPQQPSYPSQSQQPAYQQPSYQNQYQAQVTPGQWNPQNPQFQYQQPNSIIPGQWNPNQPPTFQGPQ